MIAPALPPAPERLPVATTDAHTHLASTATKTGVGVADLLERAAAVGIDRVVDVGCDLPSSVGAVQEAQAHDAVIAAVAIHPHDAVELGDGLDEALRGVEALLGSTDRIRAVGETGLDYYWVTDEPGRAVQRDAFAAHIGWAREHDLALVVHDRDAHHDLLDVWTRRAGRRGCSSTVSPGTRIWRGAAWIAAPTCRSPAR
jgi:TatD DNase family protein